MRRSTALVPWMGLTVSLWFNVEPASGQTFQPIFSNRYTRSTGAPVTVSDTFTACDPSGTFRVTVVNGPPGQGQIGTDPISSGSLSVNGVEVVHEQDFNQKTTLIQRPLAGIGKSNQLDVRIRSGPGGGAGGAGRRRSGSCREWSRSPGRRRSVRRAGAGRPATDQSHRGRHGRHHDAQ